MFSVFHYVLGLMRDHEANIYAGGIEINFGNTGIYYDRNRREENWRNYYFDSVNIVKISKCAALAVQFNYDQYNLLAMSMEGTRERYSPHPERSGREANVLFNKYFKLKSGIQAEVIGLLPIIFQELMSSVSRNR